MRIFQVLPTVRRGDGVGNHALALDGILRSMNVETAIYAEAIGDNIKKGEVLFANEMPTLNPDDIVLYHLSTGSHLNKKLQNYPCRKIMYYQNVTPGNFFRGYDDFLRAICESGRRDARRLAGKVERCIVPSEYSKNELLEMGYDCPIDVLPIVIPFEDYKKTPDKAIVDKYSDGKTNIVFVGRVAPNKCQQDIIKAFTAYKKYYNENSRLILAGGFQETDVYYRKLKEYVQELGVSDVEFTSSIGFAGILAVYTVADVFLCMSEHEGFCIPLLEAMSFDVPVIAYDCTAVPNTMGGSGLLLDNKNVLEAAGLIDRVVRDDALKEAVIAGQRERLKDFAYEEVKSSYIKYFENIMA